MASGEGTACCLLSHYGDTYPQLMVHGGMGAGTKVLGNFWLLDIDTGKWDRGEDVGLQLVPL